MQKFEIKPDGAEGYTVVATSRDIKAWEMLNKNNSLSKLVEEQRMSDFYKLAHFAAVRLGLFDGTLAEFEADNDITPMEDEDPLEATK